MLEIRPSCENCGKKLSYNSTEAMICSFECTFCKDCVENILMNVCPNCGGGLEKRPIRPKELLSKYPTSTKKIVNANSKEDFAVLLRKFENIKPEDR